MMLLARLSTSSCPSAKFLRICSSRLDSPASIRLISPCLYRLSYFRVRFLAEATERKVDAAIYSPLAASQPCPGCAMAFTQNPPHDTTRAQVKAEVSFLVQAARVVGVTLIFPLLDIHLNDINEIVGETQLLSSSSSSWSHSPSS